MTRKVLVCLLFVLLFFARTSFASGPVIFFSDITSGPATGGENNKGAFVTIWGRNFGSSRDSSVISVGGGQADNYPVWTDTKITFQLGGNAATGNIVVTTSQGDSNGIPFTVRSGTIYFVKVSGSDSNSGTWDLPWRTIIKAKNSLSSGDIAYIGDGVSQTTQDSYNAAVNCGSHGTAEKPKALIVYPGATVEVGSTSISRGFNFYVSGGVGGYSGKYWVISQFTITAKTSAISGGEGRRIIGNKITTPVGTGASAATESGASDVKILGNEYFNCGIATASKLYHNIYINNHTGATISDIEIGWNTIRDSTANRAIQVFSDGTGHADITNVSIHDNHIYNVRGNGINLSNHCTGEFKVYNNFIYNCGLGPDPYDGKTSYAGVLIGGGTGDYVNDATIYLYNNVISTCGYAADINGSGLLSIANSYAGVINIKNNIFNSTGVAWQPYTTSGSVTPAQGSYNNLFYGNSTSPTWDTTAETANPLFVNSEAGNFHIQAGSPCIDKGQDTTSIVLRDCEGVIRPQNNGVDIGAQEVLFSDITSPGMITDLSVLNTGGDRVTLRWTTPGDDGFSGTASFYNVRYATDLITEATWSAASAASNPPNPQASGTAQSFLVTGLQENTTYYFAIKTKDEMNNSSTLSNVVSAVTVDSVAPAAIDDLSLSNVTETAVTLAWSAPGDDGDSGTAAGYDIRFSTASIENGGWATATQVENEPLAQISGTQQSIVIGGLQSGITYFFAIRAYDEKNNISGVSNSVSVLLVDTSAPAPITTLGASSGTQDGEAVLSWFASGDDGSSGKAATYDLRYDVQAITDGNWQNAKLVSNEPTPKIAGSLETFTVSGLTPAATYYFALKVVDEAGNSSSLSNNVSAAAYKESIPDTLPPAAISDLSAASGARPGEVLLNWTATGDDGVMGTATAYEIRYAPDKATLLAWEQASSYSGSIIPKTAGTKEKITITGLVPDQEYYFGIIVVDNSGLRSLLSNNASTKAFYAAADTVAPGVITDLVAANIVGGEIRLTWTAPGGDGQTGTSAAYDVRYSTAPIDESNFATALMVENEFAPNAVGSSEQLSLYNLPADLKYYFAIKSADGAGNVSALSNISMVFIGADLVPPGTIKDLVAAPGVNKGEIILGWTAPGSDGDSGKNSSYAIKYATFPISQSTWDSATEVGSPPLPEVAGTYQTFLITGLSPGVRYYFAIKSRDAYGNISSSNDVSALSKRGIPPNKIADATAKPGAKEGEVVLIWTAPADAGGQKIKRYEVRYSEKYIYEMNAWRIFSDAEIEWSSAERFNVSPIILAPGQSQSVTITGLAPNRKYFFAIKCFDEEGNSSVISNVVATVAYSTDLNESSLSIVLKAETGHADGEVILKWSVPNGDADGDITEYIVKSSGEYISESGWNSATVVAQGTEYLHPAQEEKIIVNTLVPKQIYYFAIKAVDTNGNMSPLSNCVSARTGPAENLDLVYVWPNPWKKQYGGEITISHLTPEAHLKIFTLEGALVRELTEQDGVALWDGKNTEGFPVASGVYLVFIWDDKGNDRKEKIAIIK